MGKRADRSSKKGGNLGDIRRQSGSLAVESHIRQTENAGRARISDTLHTNNPTSVKLREKLAILLDVPAEKRSKGMRKAIRNTKQQLRAVLEEEGDVYGSVHINRDFFRQGAVSTIPTTPFQMNVSWDFSEKEVVKRPRFLPKDASDDQKTDLLLSSEGSSIYIDGHEAILIEIMWDLAHVLFEEVGMTIELADHAVSLDPPAKAPERLRILPKGSTFEQIRSFFWGMPTATVLYVDGEEVEFEHFRKDEACVRAKGKVRGCNSQEYEFSLDPPELS